jgi:hypothetical protein
MLTRHPSQGGSCCTSSDAQENASKGSVVAQSQGVKPVERLVTPREHLPEKDSINFFLWPGEKTLRERPEHRRHEGTCP